MSTADCITKYRINGTARMEMWKEHRIRVIHSSLPIIMDLRNSAPTEENFKRYTENYNNLLSELQRLTSRP